MRQFLLTNLVEQNGHYAWRVNLEAISAHLDSIMSFPNFNTVYEGPTLFLGGASSAYIRYNTVQTQCVYFYPDKCIHVEYPLKMLHISAISLSLFTMLINGSFKKSIGKAFRIFCIPQ